MTSARFAICNETYRDWTLDALCEHAASVGYTGLEIAPFTMAEDPSTLTEADAASAAKTIRKHGLEPIGFHWLLAAPKGMHLTTADDAVRLRTQEFAQHLCRLAGAMDSEVLVWGSPGQRSLQSGTTLDEANARAIDVLRAVGTTAAECGVRIAIEPLPLKEGDFITTCEEGIALVEAVDQPAVRLHLDTKAMSYEEQPVADVIRRGAPWMIHFHANDPNLKGPGMGDLDFVPIVDALCEIDYGGWISVEVFDLSPGPQVLAEESIRNLKDVYAARA